mgnify:CR=1 FL=1
MKRYKKKPVVIEAVQWTGTYASYEEVARFALDSDSARTIGRYDDKLEIPTLEGVMTASNGDYIIRGVKGELYPCKPDIFEQTYEEVPE